MFEKAKFNINLNPKTQAEVSARENVVQEHKVGNFIIKTN